MVSADPRKFPCAIFLMNRGTSNMGRTGRHARSVETIQAAVRLGYCGDLIERRMNFPETLQTSSLFAS